MPFHPKLTDCLLTSQHFQAYLRSVSVPRFSETQLAKPKCSIYTPCTRRTSTEFTEEQKITAAKCAIAYWADKKEKQEIAAAAKTTSRQREFYICARPEPKMDEENNDSVKRHSAVPRVWTAEEKIAAREKRYAVMRAHWAVKTYEEREAIRKKARKATAMRAAQTAKSDELRSPMGERNSAALRAKIDSEKAVPKEKRNSTPATADAEKLAAKSKLSEVSVATSNSKEKSLGDNTRAATGRKFPKEEIHIHPESIKAIPNGPAMKGLEELLAGMADRRDKKLKYATTPEERERIQENWAKRVATAEFEFEFEFEIRALMRQLKSQHIP